MNPIKALYCNQHYELKPKGKEHAAKQNATVLASLALLLNVMSIAFFAVLVSPEVEDWFEDFFDDVFGRASGRFIGRAVGLVLLFGLIGIMKLTYDRPAVYQRIIEEFERLPADAQKRVSRQGTLYFIVSLAVFVVVMVFFLIFKG